MTTLCLQCAAFLLYSAIENCRDGLCQDCCEESYMIDGEKCSKDTCPYEECISRRMDIKQDNINNLFNKDDINENTKGEENED